MTTTPTSTTFRQIRQAIKTFERLFNEYSDDCAVIGDTFNLRDVMPLMNALGGIPEGLGGIIKVCGVDGIHPVKAVPGIVQFTITEYMQERSGYNKLFQRVFGRELPRSVWSASSGYRIPILVRCTTDQFARFLILRNQMNMSNDFKSLKPEVIPHSSDPTVHFIDVTQPGG